MNDKVLYNGSMIFGGLALLLLVINICFVYSNQSLERQAQQRQSQIAASGSQNQLNEALVQALAQASVNDDDKEARDLLASQGITVKAKGGAAATSPADKKK